MLFYCAALSAQDRVISGKVTGSEDGLPLPQVSVFLKGTTLVPLPILMETTD